ncbi:MAG: hypothetical protein U0235_27395 [Polyangiaceae bacterium]
MIDADPILSDGRHPVARAHAIETRGEDQSQARLTMTMDRRTWLLLGRSSPIVDRVRRARRAEPRRSARNGKARDGLHAHGLFTQERTIGLLATKVKSTGTPALARPDRLRWELAAPDSVVYRVAP